MRIGITCYPTYGGSGVVATELGMELAARGHEMHFISYAPPVRLNSATKNIEFHEVEVSNYPLFDHAPYTLTLAVKMLEVAESAGLDLLHVHYAIPHSVSALLARSMAAPRALAVHHHAARHGHHSRGQRPQLSAHHAIFHRAIRRRDRDLALSQGKTIEEFDIKRPIEVIPNFVNCDLYCRKDDPALRAEWAPERRAHPDAPLEFPSGEARHGRGGNFRSGARKDAAKLVLIGDGPDRGAVEWLIRQKGLTKDVFLLGKQDRVYEKLGLADLFLLPSDLESFGLAALEAMACEVPVIATNVGGVPEVVEHGVDGYLVEPRDVDSRRALCHRDSFARRPRQGDGPAGAH